MKPATVLTELFGATFGEVVEASRDEVAVFELRLCSQQQRNLAKFPVSITNQQ